MLSCVILSAFLALGQDAAAPGQDPLLEPPPPYPRPSARESASAPITPPSPQTPSPGPAAPGLQQTALFVDAPLSIVIPGPSPPPADQAAPAEAAKAPAEPKRRALPSPFDSPPFPGSEYQGYPLIGVPVDYGMWPLQKLIQGTWYNEILNENHTRMYGWVTAEGNWSNARQSNVPTSYWIRPNRADLDQFVFRFERQADTVQTDHLDYGFRSSVDYGIDYRYFTAGGWFSDQLYKHNSLYGWDTTEQYIDVYIPWVAQGMILRVGRWIACPDIETQFAPDNYMGSHSLLFTYDTYTQTGVLATFKLSDQWEVQGAIHAGTDMAPWYKGSLLTGAMGVRWVSQDNNDAYYGWLNAINSAEFRRFQQYGQPLGHDNFNYYVQTWEHRFNREVVTKTEAYFMWQRNAVVGGSPSAGPTKPFGGGGGIGADIPGLTLTFGVVNFTEIQISKRDYISIRNEWWKDTDGERTGVAGTYSSHTIGLSHNFTPEFQIRPEIGFYRNWTQPAFDNGRLQNLLMGAFDVTLRF
jgi:hypothetical protein